MNKELTPLEALRKLYWDKAVNNEYGYNGRSKENNEKFYQECKELNDIIEKELKALEIIKSKRVNLEFLKCSENYEQYCLICSYGNEISKEEYDLLKEVLL